jgi:bile acid:Na+ symporter, BASS family
MDLVQLIRLAITASILLLVFALGLRATAEDATYVLRRPVLILRGSWRWA